MDKTKRCSACDEVKSTDEFGSYPKAKDGLYYQCKKCACDKVKEYQRENPEPGRIRAHNQRTQTTFGLNREEYMALMAEQGDKCPICEKPFGKKKKHLDHNHKTGEVRKFLCGTCNQAIGLFLEDTTALQATIDYLKGYDSGN
jgi:DNA repair exonuclease SbcCD ATPase subunit